MKRAKEAWERELEGVKDKARRRKILADVYWSPVEVDEYRRYGAGWVLAEETTANERMQELSKRLDAVLRGGDQWKEMITGAMAEGIETLIEKGADKKRGIELLTKIITGSGEKVRGTAKRILKRLE